MGAHLLRSPSTMKSGPVPSARRTAVSGYTPPSERPSSPAHRQSVLRPMSSRHRGCEIHSAIPFSSRDVVLIFLVAAGSGIGMPGVSGQQKTLPPFRGQGWKTGESVTLFLTCLPFLSSSGCRFGHRRRTGSMRKGRSWPWRDASESGPWQRPESRRRSRGFHYG